MFTPTRSNRVDSFLTFILFLLISLAVPSWTLAQEKDSEAPVGAVGGAVHADLFTGTATTSIPIEVPPGRQGVQPDLSLVYASGNGNGWVGMGWKLEKSVIERRTKDGLDYSADDYVVRLSGINAELVAIDQPTPPLNHTDFRAKIEGSFTRIHKKTAADGKPYFEATDKLGKKYRFGYTAASRLFDPSDDTRIFRWCLDYVIDVHGNYMNIFYTLDQNQGYLAQIDYTGNVGAGLPPTNSVIFHLEDLDVVNPTGTVNPMYNRIYLDPDPNDPNVDSPPYKTAKRLKTVEVRANNVLQRAYKLDYLPSAHTGHFQLASVQQFGSDTDIDQNGTIDLLVGTTGTGQPPTSLPAMVLGNSDEGDGTLELPVETIHAPGDWNGAWETLPGDYNGDGITDICVSAATTSLWKTHCAMGQIDGKFKEKVETRHSPGSWSEGWENLPGDYDGDGKTDLCISKTHVNIGWKTYCVLGLGDGKFGEKALTLLTQGDWSGAWEMFPGDYDGDGLMDICASITFASGWKTRCALGKGDGTFELPVETLHATGSWSGGWEKFPSDYNGDGITDLCVSITHSTIGWKTHCALGKGDGFFENKVETLHASGDWSGAWETLLGDYNGDGLTDICASITNGTIGWKAHCALGLGNGRFADKVEALFVSGNWTGAWKKLFRDYNGDGIVDICISITTKSIAGWKTHCALGKGDGFF